MIKFNKLRGLFVVLAIAMVSFSVTGWTASASDADDRPNIVLIVGDDMGLGDIGRATAAEP